MKRNSKRLKLAVMCFAACVAGQSAWAAGQISDVSVANLTLPLSTGGVAVVDIATSVTDPARATLDRVTPPSGFSVKQIEKSGDCTVRSTGACSQTHRVHLQATSACVLDGSYELEFKISCESSAGQCKRSTEKLALPLRSASFCTTR